jgi:hypothetical protein
VGVKRNDAKSIAALGFLLLQANKDVATVKIHTERGLASVKSEIDKNGMTDELKAIQASLYRNSGWAYFKKNKPDDAKNAPKYAEKLNALKYAETLFCQIINKKKQTDFCPIPVQNNTKKVPIQDEPAQDTLEIAPDVERIVGSNASFFCLVAQFNKDNREDVKTNWKSCESFLNKKNGEGKFLTHGENEWQSKADEENLTRK